MICFDTRKHNLFYCGGSMVPALKEKAEMGLWRELKILGN